MKKFSFLFLLGMLVFATSCKKDDPVVAPSYEELIVGDWDLESITADDGLILIGIAGQNDTSTFTAQSKNEDFQLEVNENKSYTTSGDMTLTVHTVESDGSDTTIVTMVNDSITSGTWTIDNDIFVMTDSNGEVISNKILELTADKLKLETTQVHKDSVEFIGIQLDVETSSTNISTYTK